MVEHIVAISVAASCSGILLAVYVLYRETRAVNLVNFLNWNPVKQFFVFIVACDIPAEAIGAILHAECRYLEGISDWSKHDNFCPAVGGIFAVLVVVILAAFSFAIIYRYQRMLMILRHTREWYFLYCVRTLIFIELLLTGILLIVYQATFSEYLLYNLTSNYPLQFRYLQFAFLGSCVMVMATFVITDMFYTYRM